MAVTLRYFTEFSKPVFQHTTPISVTCVCVCVVSLPHRKVAQSPYAKPEVSVKIRSFPSRF